MASKDKAKGKKAPRKKSAAKATAKKAPAKKTAAQKGEAKQAAAANPAAGKHDAGPASRQPVTQEERRKMIAEAAFIRSRERDFPGTDPVGDWLEAEREIDRKLAGGTHVSH